MDRRVPGRMGVIEGASLDGNAASSWIPVGRFPRTGYRRDYWDDYAQSLVLRQYCLGRLRPTLRLGRLRSLLFFQSALQFFVRH